MNAQQLRNSILQEAIEGRLVPQDPNDEPASVLLDKIRAEKKRLFKEGKLKKKDLEEKPISDEDIPFEIPKSWEWCRFSTYLDVRDGTHDSPKYYLEGVPFVTSKNLSEGKIDFSTCKFISNEDHIKFSARSYVEDGDILFAMIGSIGNPVIVRKDREFSIKNVALFKRYASHLVNENYLYYYLSFIQHEFKKIASGGVQSFLGLNFFRDWMFPLPPLAEQKRIVAKIEELLPKVEEFGKAQDALNKLNEELPDRLKKSILQEAITGRLVPQDPNDEPASVLLDKIRAEKKQLVKEGKLKKKDLEETPISEDEKPFDIPESWEWCKLNDLCIFLSRGKSPSYSDVPTNYPVFAQKCNLKDGGISLEQARFLKPETVSKWQEEYHLRTDDVLVNSTGTGTVCRTRLFNENCLGKYPFTVPDSHVSVVRTSDNISSAYICFLFNSKLYQDYWEDRLAGSTNQKELYIGVLQNTIIPLPPLAEQKRIVAKIEEVFKEIDKLKK